VLIFIDWYKPGYKAGGPIQSISNIVNQLHKKVDFFIVTRNTDYLETVPYTTVKSDEWNDIDNAKVYYFSQNNIHSSAIRKLIQEVKPNIVYCNSLYSPKFSLTPIRIAKKLNVSTILAVRGMLSKGSLGVKNQKKKLFLFLSKTIGLFNKCTFHATTIDEKNNILSVFGEKTKIIVAQNLPERKDLDFQRKKKEINQLKLITVGRIAPEKNILYSIELLKEVKSSINFDIYGPIYNQEYWNKCQTIINQLPPNIVVNHKGVLPHSELDNTLKKYHAFFSPTTGENFGHSIIEGMINSCIPIISDKTPWRNLELKEVGFDIPLDEKKIFAKKIDFLASLDEANFNKMSNNSYQYAHNVIFDTEALKAYHYLFQLSN
jgi:glycosyltransferase involved in cell wall biosynthesis